MSRPHPRFLTNRLPALLGLLLAACSTSTQSSEDPPPPARPEEVRPPDAAPPAGGEANGDPAPLDGDFLEAELNTVGWDQLSGSPVVLLRDLDSGQTLPIWIGMAEARAISLELHGIELQRPMTHDLMVNVLGDLGAVLEEVVVHDLREGTYYGLLKLRVAGQDEPRWIDTRPSDGLALALRTDARIRVARKLIDQLPDFRFQAPDTPEQVVRALGLTVVALEDVWRREFGLPDDREGIVVIATSGEARRQGILRGDLILTLNGVAAREPLDLLEAVADTPASDGLRLTYWRAGEEHEAVLDLTTPEPPSVENVA